MNLLINDDGRPFDRDGGMVTRAADQDMGQLVACSVRQDIHNHMSPEAAAPVARVSVRARGRQRFWVLDLTAYVSTLCPSGRVWGAAPESPMRVFPPPERAGA